MAGRRVTDAGEIHIAAETERQQQANRDAVLERLARADRRRDARAQADAETKPSRAPSSAGWIKAHAGPTSNPSAARGRGNVRSLAIEQALARSAPRGSWTGSM